MSTFRSRRLSKVRDVLTETIRSTPLTSAADAALMFPTLTSAQIARIASHGVTRPVTRGEVLIEGGQTDVPFFVLRTGEIEVIRPSGLGNLLVAIVRSAQFTGDVSMILGRPAQMRLSVTESGEVVQLTRDQMHALIQTDAEIREVLMGALIHRRIALVAQGIGDALLIGSGGSAATLRIKEFLARNGHPVELREAWRLRKRNQSPSAVSGLTNSAGNCGSKLGNCSATRVPVCPGDNRDTRGVEKGDD